MSVIKLGKERESLMYSGDIHKMAIRKYLVSMGFFQKSDSKYEGHLADMIFINSNVLEGKEHWIESKATKVSLDQKKFSHEILKYLCEWLKIPKESRFKFMLFLQAVAKEQMFQDFFNRGNKKKMIKSWINDNRHLLKDEEIRLVEEHDLDEICEFFSETDVVISNAYLLEKVAEDKKKLSFGSLDHKAKKLLEESERRNHLITDKCEIILNWTAPLF